MKRDLKGSSILAFPNDYVIIDIETTGLSPELDSIIEVAAQRYENGVKTDSFSSLVKPDNIYEDGTFVDKFIEELTGITNEMLSSAPDAKSVMQQYYDFIGDSVLIGHNVNFDINFIYDNFLEYISKPLANDYIDTMRLSRRAHPEEPRHRLKDLASRYGIDYNFSHRALSDCEITQSCYENIVADILNTYQSLDAFIEFCKPKRKPLKASDLIADTQNFDISHPLYGKVCVFTGTLEKMLRKEAMQLVVNLGGENGDSVTKKTNFLILGNNDYCSSIKNGKSNKQKKAEKLKLSGQDIEIIPENVFYDLINAEQSFDITDNFVSTPGTVFLDRYELTDLEKNAYYTIIKLLTGCVDISKVTMKQMSNNYTSLFYGDYNDFLRFKLTKRTKWISIRISEKDAMANENNPLFSAQQNKRQFHWKASINDVSDIYLFKQFIINSCLDI